MTREAAGQDGPSGPLAGGVALVIDASRGVGAATARYLAERGSDVIVNYRSKTRVDDFARAVADAAESTVLENGATVFVGSTEWEIPDARPVDGAG